MIQMRIVCLTILTGVLSGGELRVTTPVAQGDTIHIEITDPQAVSARFEGKRVPIFPQADASRLGLMPVPVSQKPGSYRMEIYGPEERLVQATTVEVLDAKFVIQNIRATRRMKALKPIPGEMEAVAALRESVSETRYWQGPFALPASQCQNSPFGVQRYHNGKPTGNYHRGVDLRSSTGTPIRAAADGVVKVSRMFRLHGGTVGIDHGQGLVTMYLHLSRLVAVEGALVKQGDVIGEAGATGFATGAHLHWAVYVHGFPVNPIPWLATPPPRCD